MEEQFFQLEYRLKNSSKPSVWLIFWKPVFQPITLRPAYTHTRWKRRLWQARNMLSLRHAAYVENIQQLKHMFSLLSQWLTNTQTSCTSAPLWITWLWVVSQLSTTAGQAVTTSVHKIKPKWGHLRPLSFYGLKLHWNLLNVLSVTVNCCLSDAFIKILCKGFPHFFCQLNISVKYLLTF